MNLNPSDFVAVERLTSKAGQVLAAPGDRCVNVPAESLGWLLEGGYIRLEPPAIDKPATRKRGRDNGEVG